jgi:DNA-binding NarL/FixJ family response regulator
MPDRNLNPALLVIDDDPVFLALAGSLLEQAFPGYRVDRCNGHGALGAIERTRPMLVLTDLYMPETSGLRIVESVRQLHPDVPVVVMSGQGSERDAVLALRSGAASYLGKQRLHDDLGETVRWVLAVRAEQSRQMELNDYIMRVSREFVLPNRSELIAPLVSDLQNELRRLEVCPEEDLNRFGVAVTEAVMNAMIHGNLGLPGVLQEKGHHAFRQLIEQRQREMPFAGRRVRVNLEADRTQAVCVVTDEGEGFDPAGLPDPTDGTMMLRPYGRGMLLIRTFMDEVRFNSRGNQITLVKRVKPMSAAMI